MELIFFLLEQKRKMFMKALMLYIFNYLKFFETLFNKKKSKYRLITKFKESINKNWSFAWCSKLGNFFYLDFLSLLKQVAHEISFEEQIGQIVTNTKGESNYNWFDDSLFPIDVELVVGLTNLWDLSLFHFFIMNVCQTAKKD